MDDHNYIYRDNLESPRLLTRFLVPGDVRVWSGFFTDPEALKYLPTLDVSLDIRELANRWIHKQIKRYDDKRFGLQALIEKDTNNFVGQCGLLVQEVDGKNEVEVGYHVLKKYWGQGYAPEAARLFIDYAFHQDLSNSVISIIDKNNIRSQRVAEKNGLIWEKETKWSGFEVYIYRIYKTGLDNNNQ